MRVCQCECGREREKEEHAKSIWIILITVTVVQVTLCWFCCVSLYGNHTLTLTHTHTRTRTHTPTHTLTRTHTLSFFLPLGSPQTWMTIQLKAKTLIKGLIFFTHLKKLRPLRLKKLSKKTIRSFNCFVLSQSVETSITT